MADRHSAGLADAEARRRAATDFGTNLVVLAGAGTGKTSLLVERALNALGTGEATIDSIAAITFTEKAAGEMRERLALGLNRLRVLAGDRERLDEGREADRAFRHLTGSAGIASGELEQCVRAAIDGLDRATVVTIHGFCSDLLRRHPMEAGVDPGFAVDSSGRAGLLWDDAWRAFLRREFGTETRTAEPWRELLAALGFRGLGDVVRHLSSFGVAGALLEPEAARTGEPLLQGEARVVACAIGSLFDRQSGMTPLALRFLGEVRSVLEGVASEGVEAWPRLMDRYPEVEKRLGMKQPLTPSTKLEGITAAEMKTVISDVIHLCRGIERADDASFESLLRLTAPFAREFREHVLRRGLVSYDGLLLLARDLLRDRPEIRRDLKARYRLLLVDEFQDTDPLQYEIVLFLAEEPDEDAGDAFDANLKPGRLFVVGDMKQSIYRFRGADFTACHRAIDRIEEAGGERLDLVGNFRSVPGIIRPLNGLFRDGQGGWIPSTSHQPEYVPIAEVREDLGEEPAVELWRLDLPPAISAADRREAEGRVIAEAIERWVRENRVGSYREITILFRAMTSLSRYLRPLREWGIPFVVDGGREFMKRPEVAQLIQTLRALARPADQAALLAFLRSPAGGASDVELARYAAGGERWNWTSEPDPDRFPDVARSFATLRELWAEAGTSSVDRLVRRVLERTSMLPLGAVAYEGPQRVANLQKLAAAAGALARDGTLSLSEVLDAIEEERFE